MTSLDLSAASEWNGVERRADGGYPSRIAIIVEREIRGLKVRNTVAQEVPPAQLQTGQGEQMASEPDPAHKHDV